MTESRDPAAARIAFLRDLRAVRQLRPDPLPEPVLHDILEVGRWTGSAGNRQPWEFVVVRDRDMLRRLSTIEGATPDTLQLRASGSPLSSTQKFPTLTRMTRADSPSESCWLRRFKVW